MPTRTAAERIKEKRKELNLTQKNIAQFVGISAGAVTQWELGYSTPKGANLLSLSEALRCSPAWILTGAEKRDMIAESKVLGVLDPWDGETELRCDEVELPYFTEVYLAAGVGSCDIQEHSQEKLRFSKAELRKAGVQPSSALCVRVDGNSMEPVLPSGATVGINLLKKEIRDGKIYAINHNGMLRVKVLYKTPAGIRVKSYNSDEHPDELYDAERIGTDIKIIGEMFWYSVMFY